MLSREGYDFLEQKLMEEKKEMIGASNPIREH